MPNHCVVSSANSAPRREYCGSSEAGGRAAGSSPTHHTNRGAADNSRSYALSRARCGEELPRHCHVLRRPLRAARAPTRRDGIPPPRWTWSGHDSSGRVAERAPQEGQTPLHEEDARRGPRTRPGAVLYARARTPRKAAEARGARQRSPHARGSAGTHGKDAPREVKT